MRNPKITIGIIGYGMVGKAVESGFPNTYIIISDPQYNGVTISEMCNSDPDAIFVCVPTPTDDTNYSLLRNTLEQIVDAGYTGLIIVKSTVPSHYIEEYDIVYNPEFLSRATAKEDFIEPALLLLGGDRADEAAELYKKYSKVEPDQVILTDVKTASLAKYCMNTFYATKVTFMNSMAKVADKVGVEWSELSTILAAQPWMGVQHLQVPGPDGFHGFGGPCLPKDTEAMVKEHDVELLKVVLSLNNKFRYEDAISSTQ